jgi:hypothetical protein
LVISGSSLFCVASVGFWSDCVSCGFKLSSAAFFSFSSSVISVSSLSSSLSSPISVSSPLSLISVSSTSVLSWFSSVFAFSEIKPNYQ